MGAIYDKLCPCCPKREKHYFPLSQELLEDYKSQNMSREMEEITKVAQLKIRPSNFIRERSCLPTEIYTKVGHIGEGAYGTVLRVRSGIIKEDRAMKIIKKSNMVYNVSESDLFNEIRILKSLDHPNIIKIYEFFSDDINYYIITEYSEEGDLYGKIVKISYFNERVVCNIMKQIFSAVAYLHSKNIIHGDLKLENILIDSSAYKMYPNSAAEENFDIKLIDFGCSHFFSRDGKYSEVTGTAYYVAPEVLSNEYNEKADLWSCGVIMYILLCGKPPFVGYDEAEVLRNVKRGQFSFNQTAFRNISESAKNLITALLTYDTQARPSALQVLKHQWFKNNKDDISIIDLDYSKTVLNNLKNFNAEIKFQQAVVTFITHNLVTKDEMKNLRRIFKMVDKDNDGRISKKELQESFEDVFGTVLAEIELDNLFKMIDHDNNGYIEYEEFLRATLDTSLLLNEENLAQAFNMFDIDKNGSISADEIKNVIGGGRNIPDNVIVELLDEIEKKTDENITFDEFKKIMKSIVKK
jgi:calcium-dependent protein kinase